MPEHGGLHVAQMPIPQSPPDKLQCHQTAEQDKDRLHLGTARELALA
jgi:hypothetical protein